MIDALLFAAVIGNWEAHPKNFSFLHLPAAEGGVRLAPLYDLLSVRLYPRFRQGLALSIGDRQHHGTVDGTAWLAFRKEVGLNAAYLRARARVLLPANAREAAALRRSPGCPRATGPAAASARSGGRLARTRDLSRLGRDASGARVCLLRRRPGTWRWQKERLTVR